VKNNLVSYFAEIWQYLLNNSVQYTLANIHRC